MPKGAEKKHYICNTLRTVKNIKKLSKSWVVQILLPEYIGINVVTKYIMAAALALITNTIFEKSDIHICIFSDLVDVSLLFVLYLLS